MRSWPTSSRTPTPSIRSRSCPTGMALGVTQQLPIEERHTYWREYIEDSLCVMMGGRCAEELIFGTLSTGGSNDLQRATEMARKMVREFGMSERVGPMAWGSGGEVFLGDDLMHTRDYSDVTSRVIDEEVERILRDQESRALRLLREHQRGLAAIAQALIQRETIDGAEVSRLGRPGLRAPGTRPGRCPELRQCRQRCQPRRPRSFPCRGPDHHRGAPAAIANRVGSGHAEAGRQLAQLYRWRQAHACCRLVAVPVLLDEHRLRARHDECLA